MLAQRLMLSTKRPLNELPVGTRTVPTWVYNQAQECARQAGDGTHLEAAPEWDDSADRVRVRLVFPEDSGRVPPNWLRCVAAHGIEVTDLEAIELVEPAPIPAAPGDG